jgi:hypothetical protein
VSETAPAGSPCPKCGQVNVETVRFCTRCHTLLRYACPACHHLQPHGGKCDACGVDFVEYETAQLRLARERAQAAAAPRVNPVTRGAIMGVTLLVLVVGAWWGVKRLSGVPVQLSGVPVQQAAPRVAPPVPASPPPPPPSPPPPAAGDEAQATAEVLRVLQGLRSLVQAHVNYPEYGPRAFEAKRTVERYTSAPGGDAELKRGMRETMDLYMLAATAWNAGLRADAGDERGAAAAFASVSRDPVLDSCPAARAARDNAKEDARAPLEVVQGISVVSALPAIFECAESRLADVERRMGGSS